MTFPSHDPNHADPHPNLVRLLRAYHECLVKQSGPLAEAGIYMENAPFGALINGNAPGAEEVNDLYEEMLDCLEECEVWERTHT